MIEFIVNPVSKVNTGATYWTEVLKELQAAGMVRDRDYRLHMTEYRGHATEIAAQLTAGAGEKPLIVVLGGDGTLNEVLNGLHFSGEQTIGYLPTGSGNDFARAMKLEHDPKKAVQKFLHPTNYKLLEYGSAVFGDEGFASHRFAVSSGIGYDASVCRRVSSDKVRKTLSRIRAGKLIYVVLGIAEVATSKQFGGTLTLDDDKHVNFHRAMFLSAHVQPFEGGGFKFAPHADCTDGKLEICLMANMSKGKFVLALLLSIFGWEGILRDVKFYSCRRMTLHIDGPRCVHTDGEVPKKLYQDLSMECIARKIRLIV